jgi:hypothetical protein
VVKKKIHALGRWTKRCIKIIYFLNACFGIAFLTYFTVKQEEGTYRCTMVTVSFGDVMWEHALVKHAGGELETKLLMYSHFNGVYEEDGKNIDAISNTYDHLLNITASILYEGLFDGRPRYVERNKVHGDPYDRVIPAEIVFCNEVQAWVFRHEDIRTSIDEDNEVSTSYLISHSLVQFSSC